MTYKTIVDFEEQVTLEMIQRYSITWTDASGEIEPLQAAVDAGLSAREFAFQWGEKYDLTPRDSEY